MYLNKLLEKANHQASKTHKGAFQLYQVEGRPVTFAGDRQSHNQIDRGTGNKGDSWLQKKKERQTKVTGKNKNDPQ